MAEWQYCGMSRDWQWDEYVIWCRCDGEFMVKWLELELVGSAFTLKEAKKLAEEHKAKLDEEAELDRVGKFMVVANGDRVFQSKRLATEFMKDWTSKELFKVVEIK